MAYSKLFSSIVHSSLWTEEDHVRLLFVTLLAIADREGFVYGSRLGLERLANIGDYERNPWTVLMSPDSDSSDLMRNPENQGRRIEEVPGGFRILNYSYYRSLRNEDDRREQNREAQQRYREKVSKDKPKSSQDKPESATVSQDKQSPSASASSCTSSCTSSSKEEVQGKPNLVPTAEDIYQAYPRHEARPDALTAIKKAMRKGFGAAFLLERTLAYAKTQPRRSQFTPHPATWFNRESFNDDPAEWVREDQRSKPKEGRDPYEPMSDKLWQLKHGNS